MNRTQHGEGSVHADQGTVSQYPNLKREKVLVMPEKPLITNPGSCSVDQQGLWLGTGISQIRTKRNGLSRNVAPEGR